jgi:thiol:disulfide interchange protein DsbD
MKAVASLLAFFSLLGGVMGASAQVPSGPHARTALIAATRGASPGKRVWVAVTQDLDAGWHTYWRNPGDAGEAPTLTWTLPADWRAGEIVWAAPRRLPLGPIMNYGYEGRVVMPVPLNVPASARIGEVAHLALNIDYLICSSVCVPETAKVALDLPVVAAPAPHDPVGGGLISTALAAAPKPAGLTARFQRAAQGLSLAIVGPPLAGVSAADAYFYPFSGSLIDHAKPQSVERGAKGLTLTLAGGPDVAKSPALAQAAGVLVVDGQAYEINAAPGAPPPGASGLGAPSGARHANGGLVVAMAFAFLGGLILNLMPCVFPILSLKAAALAGHAGEASRSRAQALAFLGGVVASFLVLAGALMVARAAGAAVGWGFQLQSPVIVAALTLIMLAAALNLSGLFEIGTSLQGLGSGLAAREGLTGSIFTGVLAVVVAAPCTAPFMGPALGFALTQAWPAALAVFLALGLGFAAPFTVVAFSPALIRALPRPGAWMDMFRKALAFPMYAAAAWLAWVLAQQSGSEGLARLLAAAVLLSLAAWVFGLFQHRRVLGRPSRIAGGVAGLAFVGALAVAFAAPFPAPTTGQGASEASGLSSKPWSPTAVADLRAQGRPVLVNFTAAWCVTCQVNERVVFSNPAVARAMRQTGVVYLVADWTNQDGAIAKALEAEGRIGVPLYLLYDAKGDPPRVLPQLLTTDLVVHALEAAAQPAPDAAPPHGLAARLAPGPRAG